MKRYNYGDIVMFRLSDDNKYYKGKICGAVNIFNEEWIVELLEPIQDHKYTHIVIYNHWILNIEQEKISNKTFETELSDLINFYGLDNDSNTPDYMLSKYLHKCYVNYRDTINKRKNHESRSL